MKKCVFVLLFMFLAGIMKLKEGDGNGIGRGEYMRLMRRGEDHMYKRRIICLLFAMFLLVGSIGCAKKAALFDLSAGEIAVDSALVLGMTEGSIPEEWRSLSGFPVRCEYAGTEWQAEFKYNDEGCVSNMICSAKENLSREEVLKVAEQLEQDYGLSAVCIEPMDAGLLTFTMDEGRYRVRLREEHQYGNDGYVVTMTYRIMPLDPYRSEAPFR